jgi:uncharacterized membrane protein
MYISQLFSPKLYLYFFILFLGTSGFFLTLFLPFPLGFFAFVAVLALGGLIISLTIYQTKKTKKQLICPTGSDCNAVITSSYSKFLGIPLEYLGMSYFSLMFLAYLTKIFFSQILPADFQTVIFLFTVFAFFFSLYLLFIQAFLLRQWCMWCVLASAFSITIFIFSLTFLERATFFLEKIINLFFALHSLGFVLGIGLSTSACLLFVKFLKDYKIDLKEQETLNSTSQLIWFGIFLVLISQFIFFVSWPEFFGKSNLFIVQTSVILVVVFSTAILMIIFAPLLSLIPFGREEKISPFRSLRRPVLITGAVALSSWYFAFALDYLAEYSLTTLFLSYFIVLFLAIVSSLFYEKKLCQKIIC